MRPGCASAESCRMSAGRDEVKREGGSLRLWIFDFDGTLSPLVPDRNAARLHPESLSLLKSLAADSRNRVAVLSSRSLEDLAPRIPVPALFLGGGSGLEWRLPGGHRIRPGEKAEKRLEEAREAVLPEMTRIRAFPGVDLEDKRWSVAVHFRRVMPEALCMLFPLLRDLKKRPGIRVYEGSAAAEVQFFPSVNKSFGVRRLCRILGLDPSEDRIFYAGDDENDAVAMRWVITKRGTAVAVGDGVRVPGALRVDGPVGLARTVRGLRDRIAAQEPA
ncbi:MAG: trehalose-phosphatase [Deltaproteobacteria bacterium]|nr:MAG: trehalose-phosphatase [Deltaproteobacteria bacterium]